MKWFQPPSPHPPTTQHLPVLRSSAVALLLFLSAFSGCLGSEEEIPDDFFGDDIHPAVAVEPFSLIDENGEEFFSSSLDGKVVIVVFMFTRCPDVCPVVSANVNWLYQQLDEAEQEQVEVISITVDPWTDNSSELAAYTEQMGLEWPHLTGEVEQLEPVWGNFDVGLKTVSSDEYGYQNNTSGDGGDGSAEGSGDGGVNSTSARGDGGENGTSARDDGGENSTSARGDGGGREGGSDETSGRHHPEIDYLVDHSTGTILVDKDGDQRVWWGDVDWVTDLALDDVRKLISQ